MLGNAGLTDGVVSELDRALTDHELVKVSARVGRSRRRATRRSMSWPHAPRARWCSASATSGVFYRPRKDLPKILIPDALAARARHAEHIEHRRHAVPGAEGQAARRAARARRRHEAPQQPTR